MDMSDRLWRIFTNSLMWSAEQGTDGAIQNRHFRFLYAEEITDADIDALVAAELADRTADGIQLRGWADRHGLGQSEAATVKAYRDRKRQNQAEYRERLKSRLESGDVTGHVAEHVGQGPSFNDSSKGASAYVTGNGSQTRCTKHPDGNSDAPCFGCMEARKAAAAASTPKKIFNSPESLCASGRHKWLADGTCNFCTQKKVPTQEEWMHR